MDATIAMENGHMILGEIKSWIGCPVFLEDWGRNDPLGNKWYIVKDVYEDINKGLQVIIMTTGEAFFWDLGAFKNPKFRRPIGVNNINFFSDWD